jgi:hypothetical protein
MCTPIHRYSKSYKRKKKTTKKHHEQHPSPHTPSKQKTTTTTKPTNERFAIVYPDCACYVCLCLNCVDNCVVIRTAVRIHNIINTTHAISIRNDKTQHKYTDTDGQTCLYKLVTRF